jgi:hypothetical protein
LESYTGERGPGEAGCDETNFLFRDCLFIENCRIFVFYDGTFFIRKGE